ncbi:LADA_0D04258g1_1 [Lachancea dasiensis]|uniref:LADA_0D04258g1_1 n=1 Tax=Lachancea dasiensis TaxID=1072105 RepID=A0A1G4J4W9_9SACH|nr:LADA_0D04258g1_1 [Lachancea dasiensis]
MPCSSNNTACNPGKESGPRSAAGNLPSTQAPSSCCGKGSSSRCKCGTKCSCEGCNTTKL